MEFQFRQRPLSLLIGFLLLPPYAQQDAAATATTTAHRNPAEKQRRTTWVRTTTLVGNGRCHLQRWQDDLGQTCVLTAPGSNECWYRSIVWTDGLANPTLLEAHGGKNTHAAGIRRWRHHRRIRPTTVRRRWRPPGSMPHRRSNCTSTSRSEATGVSADGSVIIGNAAGSDASLQSYRYQALSWSNGRPWPRTSRRFQATRTPPPISSPPTARSSRILLQRFRSTPSPGPMAPPPRPGRQLQASLPA